ncbi:hypothetical protein C8Q74DRAFT_756361 [Fomes fomentarius]|nr:hypothetical protein C8Q74DRAFT_756361 [Fomes fomentarius]
MTTSYFKLKTTLTLRPTSFVPRNQPLHIRTPQAPALPKQEGLLCSASGEASKYRTRDHVFVCEVRRHVSLATTHLHVVPDAHPRDIAIDIEVIEIPRHCQYHTTRHPPSVIQLLESESEHVQQIPSSSSGRGATLPPPPCWQAGAGHRRGATAMVDIRLEVDLSQLELQLSASPVARRLSESRRPEICPIFPSVSIPRRA